MGRILVVDDDEGVRSFLADALSDAGHEVVEAPDGRRALAELARTSVDLVLTDLKMPGIDGMAVLRHVRAELPDTEVIVLTAHGRVESAVEAMKLGAPDYLQKPLSGPDELALVVARALERRELLALRDQARRQLGAEPALTYGAPAMAATVSALRKVAPTAATVLLLVSARWTASGDGPRRRGTTVA